jgi:hypothetical protein
MWLSLKFGYSFVCCEFFLAVRQQTLYFCLKWYNSCTNKCDWAWNLVTHSCVVNFFWQWGYRCCLAFTHLYGHQLISVCFWCQQCGFSMYIYSMLGTKRTGRSGFTCIIAQHASCEPTHHYWCFPPQGVEVKTRVVDLQFQAVSIPSILKLCVVLCSGAVVFSVIVSTWCLCSNSTFFVIILTEWLTEQVVSSSNTHD